MLGNCFIVSCWFVGSLFFFLFLKHFLMSFLFCLSWCLFDGFSFKTFGAVLFFYSSYYAVFFNAFHFLWLGFHIVLQKSILFVTNFPRFCCFVAFVSSPLLVFPFLSEGRFAGFRSFEDVRLKPSPSDRPDKTAERPSMGSCSHRAFF